MGHDSVSPPRRSCIGAGDDRELQSGKRRFPERCVQSRDQLVESLELGHPPGVAERERREVGDPADQPELALPEDPVAIPSDDRDRSRSVGFPRYRGDEHLTRLLRHQVVPALPEGRMAREDLWLVVVESTRCGDRLRNIADLLPRTDLLLSRP